jgi:hypothetical protein
VPAFVVTVTSTVPAISGGEIATTELSEYTVNLLAASAPKLTAVAPIKPLPVIETSVTPAVLPELAATAVTDGVEPVV